MTSREEFAEQYAQAFARYVDARDEAALSGAYELGRSAVRQGHSVLDLATAHQRALTAMVEAGEPGVPTVVEAAGEFFHEALSAFELVQRALQQTREAAAAERRQAAVLRQLSTFLGDASIALDASSSLAEMLQLVAEHAREVIAADTCLVRLELDEGRTQLKAHAHAEERPDGPEAELGPEGRLAAPLRTLDGRDLGLVEVFREPAAGFTELDEAVLVQLTQMASAAVERTLLYRGAAS